MQTVEPLVPGFCAAGVRCGIKARGRDLALIASDTPATVAGVFTRSTVVGAPVEWSRTIARSGRARAIVANSGISNVAMGARGHRDVRTMSGLVARALGCDPTDVLVASTGVIGEPLPMGRLREGIPRAAARLRPGGVPDVARAIMTTDTVPKWEAVQVEVDGRSVTLAGVAKGSGMIEPNMATMLSFLMTDAAVSPPLLRRLLRGACDASFNRLTIDGEGSTSDTVLLLANGQAGNRVLRDASSAEAGHLGEALGHLCGALTRKLARDGEGATKLVHVRVSGARTNADAETAVRRIANSVLVKTALFGMDANWGRILQTLGAGRVRLDLDRAVVCLGGVRVFGRGRPASPAMRRRAGRALRADEIEVAVDLGTGRHGAELWTCDLSYDYVRINAEYHT